MERQGREVVPPREPGRLLVLVDGTCGFCLHTAHVLRRLDGRDRLEIVPLQAFPTSPTSPDRSALEAELHVRDALGRWFSGGAAMRRIAAEIPLLAPLAVLGSLPGVDRLVDRGYRVVAAHRGRIGRWLGVDRCALGTGRPDRGT